MDHADNYEAAVDWHGEATDALFDYAADVAAAVGGNPLSIVERCGGAQAVVAEYHATEFAERAARVAALAAVAGAPDADAEAVGVDVAKRGVSCPATVAWTHWNTYGGLTATGETHW